MRPPVLEARALTLQYSGGGGVQAIDLMVAEGERVSVLGPSGSGKTTLLRLIAGLERPESGEIWLDGRSAIDLAPRHRGLAMVFQEQPPYPHLDVERNLGFGLRARGRAGSESRDRIRRVAASLGIESMLPRRPAELSGGERRRVVLGRAMATSRRLVLLDEPFSALDPPLRASIRSDLIALHDRQGGAIVLVTHDQAEAMAFGHRLAIIRDGSLIQVGAPAEVYRRPAHRFVAEFLGDPGASVLRCGIRVGPESARIDGLVPGASWAVPRGVGWVEAMAGRNLGEVDLALRPEQVVRLVPDRSSRLTEAPTVVARVDRVESRGPTRLVIARFGQHRVRFWTEEVSGPDPGDRVPIRLDLQTACWFDPVTGEAINPSRDGATDQG
ncbi:ABC transporter ATP-binding protein [Tautonia plasticadhaerens]|nr:ABC transporter ATP-binding protein [Tautonia plasticadhaerens]